MKLPNMTEIMVLLVLGMMLSIAWWKFGKLFDNYHHLLTDNWFTTYAAANYLLERGPFMTGTIRRNQLQHIPNEIVTAKPKVEETVYYQKERCLAMSYRQKQSQNKPVIMLLTFDVPHRKKTVKTIPAIVDTYNQSMGRVQLNLTKWCIPTYMTANQNLGQKRFSLTFCHGCLWALIFCTNC